MDQAKTLRKMLGLSQATICPILGDMHSDYAALLGRLLLEQHAKHHHAALLMDGSKHGIQAMFSGSRKAHDLWMFVQRQALLEDLVLELAPQQFWMPAQQGFDGLLQQPQHTQLLVNSLHRLPTRCDHLYATLPDHAWALALQFAPASEWFWIVHPTAQSVTRVFHGIRHSSGVDAKVQHRVIVAGVRDTDEADHVFSNLLETTLRHVARPLQYAGHLPIIEAGKLLNQVSREMISAGRRVAKLICSLEEHALVP